LVTGRTEEQHDGPYEEGCAGHEEES